EAFASVSDEFMDKLRLDFILSYSRLHERQNPPKSLLCDIAGNLQLIDFLLLLYPSQFMHNRSSSVKGVQRKLLLARFDEAGVAGFDHHTCSQMLIGVEVDSLGKRHDGI